MHEITSGVECVVDTFDRKTRSHIMSLVRSKDNRSTEERLRSCLTQAHLSGWRSQALDVPGKPDFVFDDLKIALFVDGCFWHGCPSCYRAPSSNTDYWKAKLKKNKQRDRRHTRELRQTDWTVIRIWEHEIKKSPTKVIQRIKRIVSLRSKNHDSVPEQVE